MKPAKLKYPLQLNTRVHRWWKNVDYQTFTLVIVMLVFCLISNHVMWGDFDTTLSSLSSSSQSQSRLLSVETQKRLSQQSVKAHMQKQATNNQQEVIGDQPKAQISGIQNTGPVQFCVPYKVASAATKELYEIWKNQQGTEPYTGNKIKYTIIRDPLERLWSGFWNKCLHQIEREHIQCPNYPHARQQPPTLEEWLRKALTTDGFEKYEFNKHFIAMSKYCNLNDYGTHIYHLSSPTFNKDMSQLWKSTGVASDVVENYFPESKPRTMQDYHANAAETAKENFSCEALHLALELLEPDYQYEQYFPMPIWATEKLQECDKLEGNEQSHSGFLRKNVS